MGGGICGEVYIWLLLFFFLFKKEGWMDGRSEGSTYESVI